MPTTMEKAANLLDAQSRCTRIARAILNEPTAQAYCSPRCGPFDHIHITVNDGGREYREDDPVAYYDSENDDECYGDIPNTGLLVAALQKAIPGAGVSIVVCA